MDPIDVFSSKAEVYDRYRWSYAPQAIETILTVSGLSTQDTLADIGAGTGILTQQFAGRVSRILAIEPNPEMHRLAVARLAGIPNCHVLAARAEATAITNQSIDLITVGQAANWFDPGPARREFARILKPGGYLAILRNYGTNKDLGEAIERIFPPQRDTGQWMRGKNQPRAYFFAGQPYQKRIFPLDAIQQTWDAFLGALLTASYAPDPDDPAYPQFEAGARRVFDLFSQDGFIKSQAETELLLGQIKPLR